MPARRGLLLSTRCISRPARRPVVPTHAPAIEQMFDTLCSDELSGADRVNPVRGTIRTTKGASDATALPPVVDDDTWRAALDDLRRREKAATRELDAIAAQRRRLPMVEAAGLHADRRGRTRPPGRRVRRPLATDRLQPHVVRRRGMAMRRLHRFHLPVHPAGIPGQLRRPLRHRHQRSDRGGAGLPREGRQQDGLVLVVGELVRRRRGRAARRRLRGQRLPARSCDGHRLPHLAHQRPRHRATQPFVRAHRPPALGPSGGVAGLPRRLAAVTDVLHWLDSPDIARAYGPKQESATV